MSIMTFFIFIIMTQTPAAVVTSVNGDVRVMGQSGGILRASILMSLNSDDSVFVDQGSATILYNDGKIVAFKSNTRNKIDELFADTARGLEIPDENSNARENKLFSLGIGTEKIARKVSLRAPYDSAQICIYFPGNTALADTRPAFFWKPYAGATWYELDLKMKTETVAKLITVDTSMIYPDAKEDLLPGTYLVKLWAFYNTDTMASGECVFTLFDEGQTREVNDMISEIEKQDADDITINLLKAVVLQSKKMNHEAIDYYQKILARKPDEPVILKAVAKLYGDIGDVENANRYLSKANELIEQ